jgi:hypothetical protein
MDNSSKHYFRSAVDERGAPVVHIEDAACELAAPLQWHTRVM